MSDERAELLIQYRLDQARETLHEGDVLASEALWHGVVNRAYYAMFYSVLALAVFQDHSVSKHTGVISFFDKEFIKTGLFPKEHSKIFHLAFDLRLMNDYGEFSTVDDEVAKEILEGAKPFVNTISNYLNRSSKF